MGVQAVALHVAFLYNHMADEPIALVFLWLGV